MEQNFKNHARYITGYHRVLAFFLVSGLIGSGINLFESLGTDYSVYTPQAFWCFYSYVV